MEEAKNNTYEMKEFCRDFRRYASDTLDGYLLAMTTEELIFISMKDMESISPEKLYEQGLEIRIFDEGKEAKWFRSGPEKEFHFREQRDDNLSINEQFIHWDESQYLDIDMKKTKEEQEHGRLEAGFVYATGGGKYPLPIPPGEYEKIRIRNYLKEDPDTGELYPADWRLVGFGDWPESGKEGKK